MSVSSQGRHQWRIMCAPTILNLWRYILRRTIFFHRIRISRLRLLSASKLPLLQSHSKVSCNESSKSSSSCTLFWFTSQSRDCLPVGFPDSESSLWQADLVSSRHPRRSWHCLEADFGPGWAEGWCMCFLSVSWESQGRHDSKLESKASDSVSLSSLLPMLAAVFTPVDSAWTFIRRTRLSSFATHFVNHRCGRCEVWSCGDNDVSEVRSPFLSRDAFPSGSKGSHPVESGISIVYRFQFSSRICWNIPKMKIWIWIQIKFELESIWPKSGSKLSNLFSRVHPSLQPVSRVGWSREKHTWCYYKYVWTLTCCVWTLACCEWRVAAPGLKPLRLPRAPKTQLPACRAPRKRNYLKKALRELACESVSEFHKHPRICERCDWRKQLRDFMKFGNFSGLFWSMV